MLLTFRQFCIQEAASTSPCHTLGVSSSASPEEVKSAFRKLATLFHPDKHQAKPDRKDYEDIFKIVQAAKGELDRVTDPQLRKIDLGCRDDGEPSPWSTGDHGQVTPSGVEPEVVPQPERAPHEFRPENAARDFNAKMQKIRAYYKSLGQENSPEHIAASKAARAEFYQ